MKEGFKGWTMTMHLNMGDKPHIMQYSGEYKGYKLIAVTGEDEYCKAIDYPENEFKNQDDLFKFLDGKIDKSTKL